MMFRFTTSFFALGFAVALVHCSDGNPAPISPLDDGGTTDAATRKAPSTMDELFAKLGPQVKSFTITAETGGKIEGESVSFTIPPDAFFDMAGKPATADVDDDGKLDSTKVTGPVTIQLKEFKTAGDMIRGNLPTQTSSGQWLESGGSFVVKALSGTKEVRIARLEALSFKGAPVSKNGEPMELFLANDQSGWQKPVAGPPEVLAKCNNSDTCRTDKTCFDQAACRPLICSAQGQQPCGNDVCLGTEACPIKPQCELANACKDDPTCTKSADCRVKCKGHCDTDECKGVPICQPVPVQASGIAPDYLFNGSPFGNIGGHNAANCDAISHLSDDRLTMFVRFASNYAEESGVFFIPAGENTAVKLYTKIPSAPVGQEGKKSYELSMPIGVAGKLVVVALKDGKYFYEEKMLTIVDDASAGAKSQTIQANPVEVSETIFNAKLSAL
ncbi:hypothetical protein BH09MYX1_BH09MYX1_65020 [soil metagenome]